MEEDIKYDTIIKLSNELDRTNMYQFIQKLAEDDFNVEIDADDIFWNELEEDIIDKIIEFKKENEKSRTSIKGRKLNRKPKY